MTLDAIIEKIIPTLTVAIVLAIVALFYEVNTNSFTIKSMNEKAEFRLKYIIENRDEVKEIKSKYLTKEEYYKGIIKQQSNTKDK